MKAGDEWHADLIVTGSRGIGTLRRILARFDVDAYDVQVAQPSPDREAVA